MKILNGTCSCIGLTIFIAKTKTQESNNDELTVIVFNRENVRDNVPEFTYLGYVQK